jgi:DNA repair exonuclease SbcCD ATPase subunit
MNISLRKANTVQNSINETIRSIEIKTEIEINEFQDAASELQKANNTLFGNDSRRQKLLLSLYNIRGLVGTANANSGIDLKLATAAFVDKRISQLEDLAKVRPVIDLSVLMGKLDKIRNRKEESRASLYGRDDVVVTTVISSEQLDQIRAEIRNLKKQKQKLNDEILELNIKTEIPLSDDVVNTLTAEGLL